MMMSAIKTTTTTTTAATAAGTANDQQGHVTEEYDNNSSNPAMTMMTTKMTVQHQETAQRLLASIMYLKDNVGRSFLHTKYQLCWAKALLDRAKSIDESCMQQQQQHSDAMLLQRRFLLQPDQESGYTPLHRAVIESNLPAILLFLRHVSNLDGTERFTQHPMTILHSADNSSSNNSNTSNSSLANKVSSAVDNEGLTPLKLLGMLQRSELTECRKALQSHIPEVDIRAFRRLRPRRQGGGRGNGDDDEVQVDFFSENGDILRHHAGMRRTGGGDDDSHDDDSEDSDSDDETERNRNSLYACEVMTFGRGCALGVISSASSTASTNSSSSRSVSGNDQPYYNASTFFPQRVNEFAQEVVGRSGSAVMAAAATHHTLVVLKNGHVYSFGVEKGGRLGLGDDQPQQCPLPRRILGPLNRRQVVYVAAADNHSLCVTKDGNVFSWGSNRFGQLGDEECNNNRTSPKRVEDIRNHPCVAVAAGEKHSVALTRNGEVYVWGGEFCTAVHDDVLFIRGFVLLTCSIVDFPHNQIRILSTYRQFFWSTWCSTPDWHPEGPTGRGIVEQECSKSRDCHCSIRAIDVGLNGAYPRDDTSEFDL
jgi:Regulator of chromosome condensation (RCC1) repeat